MTRIVAHIDMDYFYAAVEEREDPSLHGKPVVVCMYSGRGERGSVSTCNYVAREFGIRSGMPCSRARQLNPDAVYLPVRKELYLEVSDRIMEIIEKYADSPDFFEKVSIDEAFIEISETCNGDLECAGKLAQQIKQEILKQEKLTCSVGIGPNKLISKMASSEQKPDGLTTIGQNEVAAFLREVPVGKLWGVGNVTAAKLEEMGIRKIDELAAHDVVELVSVFGKNRGVWLKNASNGIDITPVNPREGTEQIGRLATLPQDSSDIREIMHTISALTEDVVDRLNQRNLSFKQVSITVITSHFKTYSKNRTLNLPSSEKEMILNTAHSLLTQFFEEKHVQARRVGVMVTGLQEIASQTTLSSYF
jgi:DNA polymerase IV (DinB-like DNA polymerase)